MSLTSPLSNVGFISSLQCDFQWSRDLSFVRFCKSRCMDSKRKMRNGSQFLNINAAIVNTEIDFRNPNWKKLYQEDFERRVNLPHLTDILDVKPRPTTFSLTSRGPLVDGNGAPDDRRNRYVNNNDRALLKTIKYSSPTSAGAECIDPDCSWVEQWYCPRKF